MPLQHQLLLLEHQLLFLVTGISKLPKLNVGVWQGHMTQAVCNISLEPLEELKVSISPNLQHLCRTIFIHKSNILSLETSSVLCLKRHYDLYFSYAMCVRQESGYCCIEYRPCDDSNSWAFDTPSPSTGEMGSNCSLDFIEVSGGTQSCNSPIIVNKFCGSNIGAAAAATVDGYICGKRFQMSRQGQRI